MKGNIDLSIIIPAYNEAANLGELFRRLRLVIEPLKLTYEIIVVDDGSEDSTIDLIRSEHESNSDIKLVHLSRNFGHQAALHAGLDYSCGAAVVTMDGDLQHPPELIPRMFLEYKNGYDLVLGERKAEKERKLFKNKLRVLFYSFINKISNVELRANVADFNLYGRTVVEVLKKLPEKDRFLRGLAQWVGFKKKYIEYEADARLHGNSKYTLVKMVKLAITGITSFSAFPLRIAWWLGIAVSLSGFIYGGYIIFEYLYFPSRLIPGWTSLIIVVLIIGGAQLFILGIIGEYLFKIFYEIKGRPSYIVDKTIGF